MLAAVLLPQAVCAQDITLEDMLARDRLSAPEPQLAAWQDFAASLPEDAPPAMHAQVQLGLAIARYYTGDYAEGWANVEAAQALIASLPQSPDFEAELLGYGALLLIELDRIDDAIAWADRAQQLAEARGPAGMKDLALVQNVRGGIAFARNDLAGAEAAYCGARDYGLQAPEPDHAMVVNDASSCGALKFYLERPDTLEAMQLARDHAIAYLPDDHPKMGNVLNSTYAVLLRYGRYAEAEPVIRRHLDLERSLHSGDADNLYDPMSMLGRSLELRGKYADAEGIFRAAAELADRMDMRSQPYRRGIAQTNLARVIARQGRIADAVAVARRGVDLLERDLQPEDYHIGSGKVQLADHLARSGEAEQALALADDGLVLLEAGLPEGHSEILTARLIRARILADLGRGDEALPAAREAAGLFEAQMLDLVASETDKVALSEVLPAAFADYVSIALSAGAMEDAVHAAQLFLLSELAVPNARIAAASIARSRGLGESVERLEAARSEVAALETEVSRLQAEGGDLRDLLARIAEARNTAAEAQRELLGSFPEFVALARPEIATLGQLQARLGEGEMLVLPVALPDRAVTLAISAGDVRWGERMIAPEELGQLAARVRESAQFTGAFDYGAAHKLFDTVFAGDARAALGDADHLLFPASGYLARVSPALLLAGEADPAAPQDAPWLLRTHSIGIWADSSRSSTGETRLADKGFLGVGAPMRFPSFVAELPDRSAGGADLPLLPGARQELVDIADALGTAEKLILAEGDATESRLAAQQLDRFGVIAFATHGLVGGELPGLSEPALLLTPEDEARKDGDGLLTASEIAALKLDADWVILSACETSAGDGAGAPLYSGLARAFTQAGARSLMLSHWRVRDDAAAFLSVETVRRAAGGAGRAEALRQAQLALMERSDIPDAAHPAIWAPFVILEN